MQLRGNMESVLKEVIFESNLEAKNGVWVDREEVGGNSMQEIEEA